MIDLGTSEGRRAAERMADDFFRDNDPSSRATPRQIKYIEALGREHGLNEDALNREACDVYGRPYRNLDRRNAGAFIERLQSRRKD